MPTDQFGGISLDLAGARLAAALGGCPHPDIVAVRTLDEQLVAWLCKGCDRQLPAEWRADEKEGDDGR